MKGMKGMKNFRIPRQRPGKRITLAAESDPD
jgi:hypothetical protein